MIQNKNEVFLSSEPGLTQYLNQLRQCTRFLDNKIRLQNKKAHELLFNISTLFGIPTTRNKIEEQMSKNGVIVPMSKISQSQLDQVVRKTIQKSTIGNLQKNNMSNRQFKRNLQPNQDQNGLIPQKKRHIQFQSKPNEKSKSQSSSSQNISSKQNLEKNNSSVEN